MNPWCNHGVAGRGREDRHMMKDLQERETGVVVLGYGLFGSVVTDNVDQNKVATILVAVDTDAGMCFVSAPPKETPTSMRLLLSCRG